MLYNVFFQQDSATAQAHASLEALQVIFSDGTITICLCPHASLTSHLMTFVGKV
jgi:hypothetical protein